MVTTSFVPLREAYPSSLNPSEFYRAHPILEQNLANIIGLNRLYKAPILEINELYTARCCKCFCLQTVKLKKLKTPIVIAVDDLANIKKICIAYRINVTARPKARYARYLPVTSRQEMQSVVISKESFPGFFVEMIKEEAIGSIHLLQRANQLFMGGSYIMRRAPYIERLSPYQSSKVSFSSHRELV